MFTNAQEVPAESFKEDTALKSIDLSEVTSLGASALYNCTSLEIEDLSVPNLETLGSNAFYGVKIKKISNLGKITALPGSSNNISTRNYGASDVLEEVIVPDTVTNIPNHSFRLYTSLKEVTLPNSLTAIGMLAFWSCNSLTKLIIPSTVTSIGSNAFQNTGLTTFICRATTPPTIGNGIFINVMCPIYVPDESIETYKTATNWSAFSDRIKPLSEYSE